MDIDCSSLCVSGVGRVEAADFTDLLECLPIKERERDSRRVCMCVCVFADVCVCE